MGSDKQKRWTRRLKKHLFRGRGNRCRACSARDKLQWAHRRPTGLSGAGRGRTERLLDVRNHPRHYVLLCLRDHLLFDRGFLLPATWKEGWRCPLPLPGETTDYLFRLKQALRPPKYYDLMTVEDGMANRAAAVTRLSEQRIKSGSGPARIQP